jgi:hypothetical protein
MTEFVTPNVDPFNPPLNRTKVVVATFGKIATDTDEYARERPTIELELIGVNGNDT